MGSSTENSAFGPTHNPYDPDRVPGGSRGGSAAAVAAGLGPLALGSDTGGSIRQPAALCGVVGMKPTYGTVSRYGLVAFASSLDQIGPFSATVADAAAALRGDRRARPARLHLASTGPPPAPSRRSATGSRGCGSGLSRELVDGVDAEVAARVRGPPRCWRPPGPRSTSVSIPELRHGLPAYYLLAPAEASSNLSRYDGVRYGLRVDGDDVEAMNARHPRRRVRARGQAPDHARHLRPVGRATTTPTTARPRRSAPSSSTPSPPPTSDVDVLLGATTPDHGVRPRGEGRRPDGHVPVRRLHGPVQPGRAPRHQRPLRRRRRAGCPSACRCWPRRWAKRSCSGWPPSWRRRRRPGVGPVRRMPATAT